MHPVLSAALANAVISDRQRRVEEYRRPVVDRVSHGSAPRR